MTTAASVHADELEFQGVPDVSQLSPVRTVVKQVDVPKGWALGQDNENYEGETRKQWLHTRLQFSDFIQVWAFASKVALLAEKRKHHPDMTIGFNYVELKLTTHAAGQTLKPVDFKLAEEINQTSEMREKLRVLFENERHRAEIEEILGHPIPNYEPPPPGSMAGTVSVIGGAQ